MFYPELNNVKELAWQLELIAKQIRANVDNIEEGRGEQNEDTVEMYANELYESVNNSLALLGETLHNDVQSFFVDNNINRMPFVNMPDHSARLMKFKLGK